MINRVIMIVAALDRYTKDRIRQFVVFAFEGMKRL